MSKENQEKLTERIIKMRERIMAIASEESIGVLLAAISDIATGVLASCPNSEENAEKAAKVFCDSLMIAVKDKAKRKVDYGKAN